MNIFTLQSENYKKIITIVLMLSIAMSLVPLRPAKALIFHDIGHTIVTVLQTFFDKFLKQAWEQMKLALLEAVKQATLGLVMNQTLNWIAGGGKPQFITNWKGFVRGAANTIKTQTLANIKKFANTCLAFKGALNAALDLRYKMGPLKELECPNPLMNNPLFYKNFEVGGWPGYLDSYMPAGDFHGAVNAGANIIDGEAAVAAGAAEKEGLAGKGFASAKKCAQTAEGQKCDEIKTPGSTIGDMASDSVNAPKQLPPSALHTAVATLTTALSMMLLKSLIIKGLGGFK